MSNLYLSCIASILFLLPLNVIAAQRSVGSVSEEERTMALNDLQATRDAQAEIQAISEIAPENFPREVRRLRQSVERFFDHKKRVCNGEFSTVILNPVEVTGEMVLSEEIVVRKLNAQERRICFREMQEMQRLYINNTFQARKRYLDFIHEERIKELDKARRQALDEIEQSFSQS